MHGGFFANTLHSEEEDPDEYPFPLTLRNKTGSPLDGAPLNGN
jgi:hypothetical protein